MESVGIVLALVALATVVSAVADRLSAPAPSLLVLAGLIAGLIPGSPSVAINPDLVTLVVLPPLLYTAGHDLSLRDLRVVWRPVAVLAVGLVLATAAAVAAVVVLLTGVPGRVAFVLGAILASTDPVAVTALARTLRLPPRLEALVSAESLFNDATSLVLFRVTITVAAAGTGIPWGTAALQLVWLALGGITVGLAMAFAAAAGRRRPPPPPPEPREPKHTAHHPFLLAELAHVSGVTATVVTGVLTGALGQRLTSARNRLQLHAVSGTAVFLLESVVFSLIGLQLPSLVRALGIGPAQWLVPALVITVVVMLMRALWVFPVIGLSLVPHPRPGSGRERGRLAVVATWAGTRGVVPLAAALSVPLSAHGRPFPDRDLLLVLASRGCVITLLVLGLTLLSLTRRSGVAESGQRQRQERAVAELALAQAALTRARELLDAEPGAGASAPADRLMQALAERVDLAQQQLGATAAGTAGPPVAGRLSMRQQILDAETHALAVLLADGRIGEDTWRAVQHDLDLREVALRAQER